MPFKSERAVAGSERGKGKRSLFRNKIEVRLHIVMLEQPLYTRAVAFFCQESAQGLREEEQTTCGGRERYWQIAYRAYETK